MEETTKKKLGGHIMRLIAQAEWRNSNATEETAPAPRTQEHATAARQGKQSMTLHKSIAGNEGLATAHVKAPAPESGVNNRYSRNFIPKLQLNDLLDVKLPIDHGASIEETKSVIMQIRKPIDENRIKDFVGGERFRDWLISDSSDALVVNNCSVNLSPGADGVSLLTELILLLYEQLSKDEEAFTIMHLCAKQPANNDKMTTMQRMIRYMTSELYGYDRDHWKRQDFVLKFSKGIRRYNPRNNKSDEEAHLIIDLFMDMLPKAQKGQVIYILIDGFDFIEKDQSVVNRRNVWQFFECLYDSIRDLQNSDESNPVIKVMITYHKTCPENTRDYWGEFVADLPQPPKAARR
ncbi:uncharacterized protein BHQ10_006242 [Talaromyces amestolkiae]|uniref:Uncharacterized protein n=1 Tax=Talaromyces amestolkiae TaxID=1196081 RepID=A0A364L350_TALAM|nr:uncharacterized protein BHQ10_006242 [Talaromyces amestolkiae]RAO70230.1 hypothetical protein BHQ10_006242 [Talaromyces amestolkiae]